MKIEKRLLCCLLLAGCATQPGPPPLPFARSDLRFGMDMNEVESRWGDTDCVYWHEETLRGYAALGYGIDPGSGEVVGLPDCRNARLALYFDRRTYTLQYWGVRQ